MKRRDFIKKVGLLGASVPITAIATKMTMADPITQCRVQEVVKKYEYEDNLLRSWSDGMYDPYLEGWSTKYPDIFLAALEYRFAQHDKWQFASTQRDMERQNWGSPRSWEVRWFKDLQVHPRLVNGLYKNWVYFKSDNVLDNVLLNIAPSDSQLWTRPGFIHLWSVLPSGTQTLHKPEYVINWYWRAVC